MRTVIGMVGDLLPETGGLEHLAPQAAEVHIAERRRAPIGAARREGEVEVVHMHHAAGERLREQRGERCLAAAAAPVDGEDGTRHVGQSPGDLIRQRLPVGEDLRAHSS